MLGSHKTEDDHVTHTHTHNVPVCREKASNNAFNRSYLYFTVRSTKYRNFAVGKQAENNDDMAMQKGLAWKQVTDSDRDVERSCCENR